MTWFIYAALTIGGLNKMMEDPSDTEEERAALDSFSSSGDSLKEANIKMNAREILDTCRGTYALTYQLYLSISRKEDVARAESKTLPTHSSIDWAITGEKLDYTGLVLISEFWFY